MTMSAYSSPAGRINSLKGEILRHAVPVEVLGLTGQRKQMPKNKGNNVVYRRYFPSDMIAGGVSGSYNVIVDGSNVDTYASSHATADGVTATATGLSKEDVTVTLTQYSCLFGVTDQMMDLHEDGAEMPDDMKRMAGERMGTVRELVRYGALKACANRYYAGGTTYGTVDETLGLTVLRKVAREILQEHGKQITGVLSAAALYGTAPVEAGFIVFCHTDMEPAIRDLPGFKHVSEYAQRKVINENEIGSCERFRFILSPELAPYLGSNATYRGALVGALSLQSTSTYVDNYPCIVVGEDAWGDVALRGMDSFDVSWIPPGQKDKSDPNGQRGYVGSKFYSGAAVLNAGWMAVIMAGAPSLS